MNEALVFAIAALLQALAVGIMATRGQGKIHLEIEVSLRRNGDSQAKLDKG